MPTPPPAASASAMEGVEGQQRAEAATPAPVAAPQSPSRRALSFEEFREFYVASKQSDFVRQTRTPLVAAHYPRELEELRAEEKTLEQERRRVLAEELCADLNALAQQGQGNMNGRVDNGESVAQRQPQPQGPGLVVRIVEALLAGVGWLMVLVADNIVHLLQFSLLGYLVYTQSDGDSTTLLFMLGAFGLLSALRAVVRNFRIGHETGTVSAPSLLGRLFKPAGHTGPVSRGRKAGYIAAKCFEALLLSVFPTYSVERLETELGVDGIVR